MTATRSSTIDPFYDARSTYTASPLPSSVFQTPEPYYNSDDENDKPKLHRSSNIILAQRALLNSLDVEHRENLASHLYTTWQLGELHRSNTKTLNRSKAKGKRSNSGGSDIDLHPYGEVNVGEVLFKPSRLWRAWPLPVEHVPREVTASISSHIVLQENLVAIGSRQATCALRLKLHDVSTCADDELIEDLCLPTITETLRKFDKLLVMLYTSRSAYSQFSENDDGYEQPSRYKRSKAKKKTIRTTENVERSDVNGERDKNEVDLQAKDGSLRMKEIHSAERQSQLALLSAEDVIHHASLVDWSPRVLHRAGARLNKIFPGFSAGFVSTEETRDSFTVLSRRWSQGPVECPSHVVEVQATFPSQEEMDCDRDQEADRGIIRQDFYKKLKERVEEKEQRLKDLRAKAGVVSPDGFLEEIPRYTQKEFAQLLCSDTEDGSSCYDDGDENDEDGHYDHDKEKEEDSDISIDVVLENSGNDVQRTNKK